MTPHQTYAEPHSDFEFPDEPEHPDVERYRKEAEQYRELLAAVIAMPTDEAKITLGIMRWLHHEQGMTTQIQAAEKLEISERTFRRRLAALTGESPR